MWTRLLLAGLCVVLLGCDEQPLTSSLASARAPSAPASASGAGLPPAPSGAEHTETRGRVACEIKVSGHQQLSWSTYWKPFKVGEPRPTHTRSTYWASEEELRVAELRRVAYPLEFTCAGRPSHGLGGAFSALSSSSSKEQVPLGPGVYPLVGQREGRGVEPGSFAVGVLLVGEHVYQPNEGKLELKRFDARGVAGSFSVTGRLASDPKKTIVVRGKFDIPCGDVLQSKCQSE